MMNKLCWSKNASATNLMLFAASIGDHELLVRRGVSIEADAPFPWKLHPYIWVTFEAFLAYLLQPAGFDIGLDLHPATDDLGLLRETMRFLDVYVASPRARVLSRAHVISLRIWSKSDWIFPVFYLMMSLSFATGVEHNIASIQTNFACS